MQRNNKIVIISVIAIITALSVAYSIQELNHDRVAVQDIVRDTIATYDGDLDSVVLISKSDYYSFVIDNDLKTILVHPRQDLVGTTTDVMNNANIPFEDIKEALDGKGSVWVEYEFDNPKTGNVDPKTAYLVKHEGYIFGAGFYSP